MTTIALCTSCRRAKNVPMQTVGGVEFLTYALSKHYVKVQRAIKVLAAGP